MAEWLRSGLQNDCISLILVLASNKFNDLGIPSPVAFLSSAFRRHLNQRQERRRAGESMGIYDPVAWSEGDSAFKSIFEGLRSAIAMLRDLEDDPQANRKAIHLIDAALDKAARATAIAEAEVANALGFELCKCAFPPTPMLFVGYIDNAPAGMRGPVYECPKCGSNSARGADYTRIATPREGK